AAAGAACWHKRITRRLCIGGWPGASKASDGLRAAIDGLGQVSTMFENSRCAPPSILQGVGVELHRDHLLAVHDYLTAAAAGAMPVELELVQAADAPRPLSIAQANAAQRQPPQRQFVDEAHFGLGTGPAR